MKRLIVRFPDGNHCNLGVTRTDCREEDMVFAYCGDELVGVFDLGSIAALYITEGKGG